MATPTQADPHAASPSGPSIDPAERQQQRRARRAQLRDFYGIKSSPADAAPGSANVADADAAERPRAGTKTPFDAAAYYSKLVAESSLVDLMLQAGRLSNDVGNLHSARHALVYNHHHQLFSAGDTIQVLNSHTPQLLSIVTELQSSFSSISQLVDSVGLPETLQVTSRDTRRERLALMLEAEATPSTMRPIFEALESALETDADNGDSEARQLLDGCRLALKQSPEPAEQSA